MPRYNVAARVVTLIEAPDEETARRKFRTKMHFQDLDILPNDDGSDGVDAFVSEPLDRRVYDAPPGYTDERVARGD